MSKRRNENAQMRREEVEQLDDDASDEEMPKEGFEKAPLSVLAERKILKVKRKTNPNNDDLSQNTAAKPVNPFAGLGSFLTVKINEPIKTTSFPSITTSLSDNNNKSTYEEEISQLNRDFLKWIEVQIVNHPIGLWKDAMVDYINHAKAIADKYNKTAEPVEKEKELPIPIAPAPKINLDKPNQVVTNPTNSTAALDTESNKQPKENQSNSDTIKPAAASWLSFGQSKLSASAPAFDPIQPIEPAKSTPAPFQFGLKQTESSADKTKSQSTPFPISFGSALSSVPTAPSGSTALFQFGSAQAPSTGVSFPTTTTTTPSFSLSSFPPLTSSFGGNPTIPSQADEEGDDEGEPILEPEKALRNENDKDEILFEASSKILRFDKSSNEWKDTGKGTFRVTKNPETNKPRMLMRNLTGKIMFNAGFYNGMKFDKVKGGVKFSAVTASESGDGQLNLYLVKVKEVEVNKLYESLGTAAKLI